MTMRRFTLKKLALRAVVAGAVISLCAVPFILSSGSASTLDGVAVVTNPYTNTAITSGGSSTVFTIDLPTGADCTGDTTNDGYHVYSYLVPQGTSPTSVDFATGDPSTGYGFFTSSPSYYGPANTAPNTGEIISIPEFEWGPAVTSYNLRSDLLYSGTKGVWEGGIACANSSGTVTDYWNTEITFTSSESDPDGFVWTAAAGGPTLLQTAPTGGSTDTAQSSSFSDQLEVSGAVGSPTYTLTSPSSGLAVSSSGSITTTGPLATGAHTISGSVSSGSPTFPGSWTFTLTVSAGTISQTAPTSASVTNTQSSTFSDQLEVNGAIGSPDYTVTSSSSGLDVSSSGHVSTTGSLTPGSYTSRGNDSDAYGDNGTWVFTLTVSSGTDTFTSSNSATATVGLPFSFSVTTNPSSKLKTTGKPPKGIKFDKATGVLSGTPVTKDSGVYNFTFVATFGKKASTVVVDQSFALTVDAPPVVTSKSSVRAKAGTPFTFTVSTGYAYPSSSVTISDTTLPAGVSLVNQGNGTAVISGTLSTGGTYTSTIQATNSVGTGSQSFTIKVKAVKAKN
jgi:Putative Ig domain